AGELLRQASAHFESVGDELMLAECLALQSSLAYMTQRPGAIALAERALAVCRRLKPVPETTEARVLGVLAAAHLANSEWESAMKLYNEAIEVGGALNDLGRLALMYHGMGMAYRATGQNEAAARYANRSLALLEVVRDRASLARIENDLGLLMMAKGDHQGAHQHLDRALELTEESEPEAGRANMILSLSELSLQEGNIDAAAELAEQGLRLAEQMTGGAAVAVRHMWLGRGAEERGDDVAVDREFELALVGLSEFGVGDRLLR